MNRPTALSPAAHALPRPRWRAGARRRWLLATAGGLLAPLAMLGALSPLLRTPTHPEPAVLQGALRLPKAVEQIPPAVAPAAAAHAATPPAPATHAPASARLARPELPAVQPAAVLAAAAAAPSPATAPAAPASAPPATVSTQGVAATAAPSAATGTATAVRPGNALDALPLRQRCPEQTPPSFPRQALEDDISAGRVLARLHLDAQGAVREVTIVEAEPRGYFEAATRRAALRWHCLPAAEAGASVLVPFVFRTSN